MLSFRAESPALRDHCHLPTMIPQQREIFARYDTVEKRAGLYVFICRGTQSVEESTFGSMLNSTGEAAPILHRASQPSPNPICGCRRMFSIARRIDAIHLCQELSCCAASTRRNPWFIACKRKRFQFSEDLRAASVARCNRVLTNSPVKVNRVRGPNEDATSC